MPATIKHNTNHQKQANTDHVAFLYLQNTNQSLRARIANPRYRGETINALSKINPPIESLRKIYKAALENEDYETCDAIKAFFERF
ncbi:hypothetical protein B0A68_11495 [Flavobacterium reichenbachii]|uniref:Uncharacterized protein n=1 Tax=Flavobacterium reichenbachii TaxID=362418 RepID=A0A085ZNU1_9FLAO|nr:hypothetical protein IW19_11450 [Flavobacterium reichenbachii]OXB14671.1 hypothetical protein B0A68_11495 [Flavobacterium reichenbachii]